MTVNINQGGLKTSINRANPNTLADAARLVALGDVLRASPTFLRKKAPAASSNVLATLLALSLNDDAKASTILRAYARTATAGTGELTVVAFGTTPTTGQIAVAPNGDIVTLAADAITSLDVLYQPEKGDVYEQEVDVATNVLTIPTQFTSNVPGVAGGVILLHEAVATVGTATGNKIILVPGAGAPAAGQARLNLAKTTVTFAGADAVTRARIKFSVVSATDVDALLNANTNVQ